MTLTQVVVILAGLFFGYRLVSHLLSPGTGEQDRSSPRPPDGQDRQGRANGHWRDYGPAWSDAPPPAPPPAWYQVLGVAESASLDDIERAYRQQISQYHPDKVARLGEDLRQLAEQRSREINAAYDIASRLRRG
ncbi:J domain-containing protein [Rhodanobacter sp. B2A1Ga4]|uniref:J domain-containing protein n=1 Tax=Rhodanobacter TaxID=75309 RepID=UPI000D38718B|nr:MULTISPECIES: J domain-containing protein [Rhodanobacter]MBQ4854802.1 J domain-containing protein [Rhodanobacter sp. B2A1Ga4]